MKWQWSLILVIAGSQDLGPAKESRSRTCEIGYAAACATRQKG